MPDTGYLIEMIGGVPVVVAPAEIDATTAEQLRAALLEAAAHRHATIVVDMTNTHFCDSAGLGVLTRGHKRALEGGGEVRVVIPPGGAVDRIFTLTSLYRFMPRFGSLPEALRPGPEPAVRPLRPDPPAPLGQGPLKASVADGESGPVITLSGEADTTSVAQLSALMTVQLSGGTRHLTIDVSELSFADSATIQALLLAAKTLKERDGTLVLLHPQPTVVRVLALTGAEQAFTIRDLVRISGGGQAGTRTTRSRTRRRQRW
jgi:anti-sigma B factor antagonist